MTTIGTFTRTDFGFTGSLEILTIATQPVTIIATGNCSESDPDYRVYASDIEVGAAWTKQTFSGGAYVAVTLDDPTLKTPISSWLMETEAGVLELVWSRSVHPG